MVRRIKLEYSITYRSRDLDDRQVMLHVEPANLIVQIQDICNTGGIILQVISVPVEIS
jgi:hypothetical protein